MFLYAVIFSSLIELVVSLVYPHLNDSWRWYMFVSLPIQLPTFMLGFVTFFLIYDTEGKKEPIARKTIIDTIKYLFTVTIGAELIFFIIKFAALRTIDISVYTPRVYIESVMLVCLILFLANGYFVVLKNKLFRFFGKISYSLYLTHFAILAFISKLSIYLNIAKHMNVYVEYLFLLFVTLLLSSAISYGTHALIEKPGQTFGKYVSKKLIRDIMPSGE